MNYKNLCSQVLLRSMELTEIATIVESTPAESRTKMLQVSQDWIMQSAPPGRETPKSSALVPLIAQYVKSTGIINDTPALKNEELCDPIQEQRIASVFLILLFLASSMEGEDDTDSIDDDRQVQHLFEHLLLSKKEGSRPSDFYWEEYKLYEIDQPNLEVRRLISEFWKWEGFFHSQHTYQ